MTARLLLPFLCICSFPALFGQSMVENQEKYWDYRERLLEGYMVVGEGQGKSLPASHKDEIDENIAWSDATIQLAWYMSVLATEYHLLNQHSMVRTEAENEIKKEQTLQEIYYALKTIERLDSVAEPFFNPELAPAINGFFIRDDVPKDFLKNLPGIHYIKTDYMSPKISDNEASQDQIHHLLMGLMNIYRFVPEVSQYKGVLITTKAKEIALRLIDWTRLNGWDVVNPAELDAKGRPTKVERGPDAYIYSAGTMKIRAQFEAPKKKKERIKTKLNPLNKLFWSSMRMGINPNYIKHDNAHMSYTLIATGNGFKKVTYRKLAKKSFKDDWYAYPLLNVALYPNNRRYRKDEELMQNARALLDSAPPEGTNDKTPATAETGWSVRNRFMRKNESLYSLPKSGTGAQYPGFDYMLLHNLYLIHQNDLLLHRRAESN